MSPALGPGVMETLQEIQPAQPRIALHADEPEFRLQAGAPVSHVREVDRGERSCSQFADGRGEAIPRPVDRFRVVEERDVDHAGAVTPLRQRGKFPGGAGDGLELAGRQVGDDRSAAEPFDAVRQVGSQEIRQLVERLRQDWRSCSAGDQSKSDRRQGGSE